jgi:hypothetical protein
MATALESISPALREFIEAQHVFFVATAPRADQGHINLSPKGMDTFRVLTPTRIAYLDLTGSGNETAAHVLENGRITFMFCAFEGKPLILRLYGRGRSILPDSPEWADLACLFAAKNYPSARQIILADLSRIQTSCGFGVPLMTYTQDRDGLQKWAATKTPEELIAYREKKNRASIDGLPAPWAHTTDLDHANA